MTTVDAAIILTITVHFFFLLSLGIGGASARAGSAQNPEGTP